MPDKPQETPEPEAPSEPSPPVEVVPPVEIVPPSARPPEAEPASDPARRRFTELAGQLRDRPVGRLLAEYLTLRRQFRGN